MERALISGLNREQKILINILKSRNKIENHLYKIQSKVSIVNVIKDVRIKDTLI